MAKTLNSKPNSALLVRILGVSILLISVAFGAYSYGSTNRIDLENRITATETTCQYLSEQFTRIDRKLDMVLERMPR